MILNFKLFYLIENSFLSHSLIKFLRTLLVKKRSENTVVDKQYAINDANSLIENEDHIFIYENNLIK